LFNKKEEDSINSQEKIKLEKRNKKIQEKENIFRNIKNNIKKEKTGTKLI
jgi:hypothetical protein